MSGFDPEASMVTVVSHGEYLDRQILGLFADPVDAQRFADHWNLTHIDDISRGQFPAYVDGTLPFYEAGQWRPRSTEVIDGSLAERPTLGT